MYCASVNGTSIKRQKVSLV